MSAGWIVSERGGLVNLDGVTAIDVIEERQLLDAFNPNGIAVYWHIRATLTNGTQRTLARCESEPAARLALGFLVECLVVVRDMSEAPMPVAAPTF